MRKLNTDYLDTTLTTSSTWYNGTNNKKEATFTYTNRLGTEAQSLIDDATWYLAGVINKGILTLREVYV